jgi:hypothetical protein
MTRRVTEDYQLPPGQLWWILRYSDGDNVSETLFTFEGERKQTWFYARQWSECYLTELGLMPNHHYIVSLYDPN